MEELAKQKELAKEQEKLRQLEEQQEKLFEKQKIAQEQEEKAQLEAEKAQEVLKRAEEKAKERKVQEIAKQLEQEKLKKQQVQYLAHAKAKIEKVDAIQAKTEEILASKDLNVKKTRIDIKLKAGVCNQISAAPSAIRNVVEKINQLLQEAKAAGEVYFNFAMDLVATNLVKQARVVLDYKYVTSCFFFS